MSRWKLYDNWDADVRGLTIDQLRERQSFARMREQQTLARGMGRNPKAARAWRSKLAAVEDELARREAAP